MAVDPRFTAEQLAAAQAARDALPAGARKMKPKATTDTERMLRRAVGQAKAAQTRAANRAQRDR